MASAIGLLQQHLSSCPHHGRKHPHHHHHHHHHRRRRQVVMLAFLLTITAAVSAAAELPPEVVRDVIERFLPGFKSSSGAGGSVRELETIFRAAVKLTKPGGGISSGQNHGWPSPSLPETPGATRTNSSDKVPPCIADPRLHGLCTNGGQCLPLSDLARPFGGESVPVESLLVTLCPVLLLQSHMCSGVTSGNGSSSPPHRLTEAAGRGLATAALRSRHASSVEDAPFAESPGELGRSSSEASDGQPAARARSSSSASDAELRLGAVAADGVVADGGKAQMMHKAKPDPYQVWLYGLLSVSVISACSLTGLAVVPLMTRQLFDTMMNIFQGLAVGSLCGSAVFHLIPQAFKLTEKDASYLWKSLVIWGGIYFFYLSERVMKLLAGLRKEKSKLQLNSVVLDGGTAFVDPHGHARHSHGLAPKDGTIASVAWLVIFGDGMHNFIDGLSLGAAFNNSILGGVSISVAVICEEFPHELGDFAVLIGAGMSARQAVLYNFLSALTCFLGLAVGILIGDLTEGTPAIFAFAGGMFLYISLVGMMSEINECVEQIPSFGGQVRALILQNIGILVGVATMFVMAKYAEAIDFEAFSMSDDDDGQALLTNSLAHINRDPKGMLGTGF